jgi:hypothetical protein
VRQIQNKALEKIRLALEESRKERENAEQAQEPAGNIENYDPSQN